MPRDRSAVTDMLIAAELALEYVRGLSQQQFVESQEKQDAVVRRIEIIGEAAGRVSRDLKARFPEIPWREAAAMRNRVIHGYDTVDANIVWDTLRNDIPSVVEQLRRLLEDRNVQ